MTGDPRVCYHKMVGHHGSQKGNTAKLVPYPGGLDQRC